MRRYARRREGSVEAASAKRRRTTALGESATLGQLETRRPSAPAPDNEASPSNCGDSSCESANTSGGVLAPSCCSTSRSVQLADESPEFAYLEKNAVAVEYFASSPGHSMDFFRERKENLPSSEVHTAAVTPPASEKTPTEAELEEFFAAAEKNMQKQFIEKYNYDIMKDEPLEEGRYEWVPVGLKP